MTAKKDWEKIEKSGLMNESIGNLKHMATLRKVELNPRDDKRLKSTYAARIIEFEEKRPNRPGDATVE